MVFKTNNPGCSNSGCECGGEPPPPTPECCDVWEAAAKEAHFILSVGSSDDCCPEIPEGEYGDDFTEGTPCNYGKGIIFSSPVDCYTDPSNSEVFSIAGVGFAHVIDNSDPAVEPLHKFIVTVTYNRSIAPTDWIWRYEFHQSGPTCLDPYGVMTLDNVQGGGNFSANPPPLCDLSVEMIEP